MRIPIRIFLACVFAVVLAGVVDVVLRAASENPFPAREATIELERIARALGEDADALWASGGEAAALARIAGSAREHGEETAIRLVDLGETTTASKAPGLDKEALGALEGRGVEPTAILGQTKQASRVYVYRMLRAPGRRAIEVSRAIRLGPAFGDTLAREATTVFLVLLAVGGVLLLIAPRMIQREIAEAEERAKELAAREANEREEALEELRRAERLSTVGRIASNLAHELGTPLNVIAGRGMMIASGEVTGAEVADNGKIIVEQANKMTAYIKTMLGHARKRPARKVPADVEICLRRVTSLMGRYAARHNIRLEISGVIEPAVLEMGDLELIQVLTNLMTNAVQAMPSGGTIQLGAQHVKKEPPGQSHVAIWVKDAGVGIAKEDLPNIFKPFFTTKTESAGTGLGLSIAQGIVREHGGWIDVDSELGKGSCFTVCVPGFKGGA